VSVLTVGRRSLRAPGSVDPVSRLAAALESEPATLVVEPPELGDGFWAGGPSAYVGSDGIYLAYRLRRPVVQGRGYANVVARSLDGVRFTPVATVTMQQFDCASLERPALVQRPDGGWRLYVSCSTPGSKHWWVEAVDADTPAGLSTGRRTVVLPGDEATAWKDVVVRRDGNAWQMWACRHLLDDGEDNADRMDTWYFTSSDGLRWTRQTLALGPSPTGWDRRGARLTSVNRVGREWIACYDGRATAAENWYERTGIAVGSPESFRPAAGPLDRGGRTLRYVSLVEVAGGHRCYFEADRPDGSNALYTIAVSGLG
jgi:hypothetical protein